MKNILIIVDGNKKIGLGHWSRCLELARNLKKDRINCVFLIKSKMLLKYSKDEDFKIISYSSTENRKMVLKKIIQLNKKLNFDGIILDLRGKFSETFLKNIKKISKVIIIGNDDLENISLSDMVILPEIKEQFKIPSIKKEIRILHGPKYALLGKKLEKRNQKKKTNQILMSIGGGDKRNLSIKIIKEFKKRKELFLVKIVIGKFFNDIQKIKNLVEKDDRFEILENVKSLIPLMDNAKFGIFTMGISIYEAMYVGLPAIVISHSKQNQRAAQKFKKYQCFINLGYYKNIEFNKIPNKVLAIINDENLLKNYSKNGQKLIDGKGSLRVSKEIKKLIMN